MAASPVGKEVEKHLECGICFDRFCLGKPEEPKMLPCQHTYCKKCLGRLVTRAGPEDYKVTCPECKRETEIPGGDVTRLQSNFLINRLLSIRDVGQSAASLLCEKHEGEEIKVFCETCDRSLCRDCAIEDHGGHKYKFIKDVFPAEKEKIMNSVRKVSGNIPVLKSAIESIQIRETKVQENVTIVSQKVDTFVDHNIALLESKRKSLKQDLERLSMTQMKQLSDQKQSLSVSLGCAETGVEFAEQALASRSEVEILSIKNQIIQQMTELSTASESAKLLERIVEYNLETNAPLDDESVGKMAKIRETAGEKTVVASRGVKPRLKTKEPGSETDEFVLNMLGGEPGVIYTTRAEQTCHFVISPRNNNKAAGGREDEVEVTINRESPAVTRNQDGTYSFSYRPLYRREYVIVIRINGSPTCGSPRPWEVRATFGFFPSNMFNYLFGAMCHPSTCVFTVGQHSWKTQLLLQEAREVAKMRLGVIHATRNLKSFWQKGRHILSDSKDSVLKTVASTIPDFQHGDVFVCYLNIDKGQLIIYNERTKQSDTFFNIEASVSPLISPEKKPYFEFNVE